MNSSIDDELAYVKNMGGSLPPYAYFLAGAASQKTSLSVRIIFQMVEQYYDKLSQIQSELQIDIEKYLYEGKLGKVKNMIPKAPDIECGICDEPIKNIDTFIPENCCDMFHVQCMYNHVQSNMNVKIQCPLCSCELMSGDIQRIDNELHQEYLELTLACYLAEQNEVITCKNCRSTIVAEGDTARCNHCLNTICTHCQNVIYYCTCSYTRSEPKLCFACKNLNYNHQRAKIMCCGKCGIWLCFDCNQRREHCRCIY